MIDIELRKWCLELAYKDPEFLDGGGNQYAIAQTIYQWVTTGKFVDDYEFPGDPAATILNLEKPENLPAYWVGGDSQFYTACKPALGFDPLLLATVDEFFDICKSPRIKNCLRNHGYNYMGDLTNCFASQLLQLPNFGMKGLREVQEKLNKKGLSLRRGPHDAITTNFWPPENIEMLRELYREQIEERLKND